MTGPFICKIASPEDMEAKWAYEIARHEEDKENWIVWKRRSMENYRRGHTLPYYGQIGRASCRERVFITV